MAEGKEAGQGVLSLRIRVKARRLKPCKKPRVKSLPSRSRMLTPRPRMPLPRPRILLPRPKMLTPRAQA